jgi:hypothetical protein
MRASGPGVGARIASKHEQLNRKVGGMGDLVHQYRRPLMAVKPVKPPQQTVGDEDRGIVATSGRQGVV